MNRKHDDMPVDMILIHGAWQGSWVWKELTARLEAAGIRCHCVDLPGNGCDQTPREEVCIELYIDHITSLIDRIDGAPILLAHSGAGVIATAVAEQMPERIAQIIYLAGMMLPAKMTYSELIAEMLETEQGVIGIEPFLQWSEDESMSWVPPEAAADIFLNDLDRDTAIEAAQQLSPQATRGLALATDWSQARFGSVPRTYIECSRDNSVKPVTQQRMQQLVPGAKCVRIDAGHAPQLSEPKTLANILIREIHAQREQP